MCVCIYMYMCVYKAQKDTERKLESERLYWNSHLFQAIGAGLTLSWQGFFIFITEQIKFVVFPYIATASPKCSVRCIMLADTGHRFHFLFDKKHAFSLFWSNIQGLLCVRCWESVSLWRKSPSFECEDQFYLVCIVLDYLHPYTNNSQMWASSKGD